MAEERKLIQDGSGSIYIYTDALAKRKDMKLYRPDARLGVEVPEASRVKRIPIELQGNMFLVDPDLHAVLMEMGGVMVALQDENASLKKQAEDFEALKERLTTDIDDLTEQLQVASQAKSMTPDVGLAGAGAIGTGADLGAAIAGKIASPATKTKREKKA
jgi:hypothetical protein